MSDPQQIPTTIDEAKELGFLAWDAPDEDGNVLMLFIAEMYDHIEKGTEIEFIDGEVNTFSGFEDRDVRYGALAFGVRVGKGDGPEELEFDEQRPFSMGKHCRGVSEDQIRIMEDRRLEEDIPLGRYRDPLRKGR